MAEGKDAGNGRLLPIMREGVEIIKMVFYQRLKEYLAGCYADREELYSRRLAGCVINTLFGIENTAEPFASFAEDNRETIRQILQDIPSAFTEMRIPLTDGLRVQFLCDSMEGFENPDILIRADKLGILLHDRQVPLPKDFLALVRRLGASCNLLIRQDIPGAR
jgi:hypothetical protein